MTIHLHPNWEDHDAEPSCWCGPGIDYIERDDGTLRQVWWHRSSEEVDRVATVHGRREMAGTP